MTQADNSSVPVLVAGVGRSGTTWLADLINYEKRYRISFEPFHPRHGVAVGNHFQAYQYLRADHTDPQRQAIIQALLHGDLWNAYVDQDNAGAPTANRLLIKEIRINLLLGWLAWQFPDLPIVYIVRHPQAVITSKIRLNWSGHQRNLRYCLEQPDLLADHLRPFVPLLRQVDSAFEHHLHLWCIASYVVFRQWTPGRMHLVFYEDLLRDPLHTMRQVFAYLRQPLDEALLSALVHRPSRTTWRSSEAAPDPGFSLREAKRMQDTLAVYGLAGLYADDQQPDHAEAHRLLTAADAPQSSTLNLTTQRILSHLRQARRQLRQSR